MPGSQTTPDASASACKMIFSSANACLMTELQRLLLAYDRHRAEARSCALATVVEVLGSAYRRPGARMLVTADGGVPLSNLPMKIFAKT